MAQPMVDVSSITIFPSSLPCQVYGHILVCDKNDSKPIYSKLYERDVDHADVISEIGQELLLTGLDIVISMRKPVISILLKDKAQDNAFIAHGDILLDNTTSNDYEQLKCPQVKGDRGHVKVNYIALACAVGAEITIKLHKDVEETVRQEASDKSIYVSGSIVARYGRTYECTASETERTILNIPSNQPILVSFVSGERAPLHLTRSLVAVPAYTSLTIVADIREKSTNDPILNCTVEFLAFQWRTYSSAWPEFCIKDEQNRIGRKWEHLDVMFNEAFDFQNSYRKSWLAMMSMKSLATNPEDAKYGRCLLEVFSFSICRKNDEELNVSGTINVEHNHLSLNIFNRDGQNPVRLSKGRKLLPFTISEFIRSDFNFHIRVKLEDADGRLLIKDGAVHFDTEMIADREMRNCEYNRLLCAVVQGEQHRGDCVVHYANFRNAVGIQVKSVLICKGSVVDILRVYGRVVAWSGIFDYTSDYDKKYYRKVLFDNPEDSDDSLWNVVPRKTEEEESPSDGHNKMREVDLFTSNVVMPLGFPLLINVDLHAASHFVRGPTEHLEDTLKFQLHDESPLRIEHEDFEILFHMKWIKGL
ncbi:hypothetical protein SOVF_180140 [Spinacia oleracea]|uniref:Uncharacterized protein LOC110786378 n=1 Tax=Spinacia oleracea TaxID=3562 RepID=A0A9R0ICF2_SPIOL|nr:uncharacterized protein LOC110786378 [Spinacia oleracea]XP_056687090.1 uncharacterized protein LOC110786378 [Spinacia oleracea]XP_056687091.1 uncharacterized protein LOC110786378 [Spinacia oleracea]KNA06533.1 hypothetical protein SOVF_180140 [Spinacia oleracea]